MQKIKITPQAEQCIRAGQCLFTAQDMSKYQQQDFSEGEVVQLWNESQQFVAQVLIGRQNKGLGWVFSKHPKARFDDALIYDCLQQAIEARQSYFEDEATTAFRLFNGEGDGIGGLTIDWYDHFIQLNWYAKGVYKYQAIFVACLLDLLPQISGIYETLRFELATDQCPIQHIAGQTAPQPLIIKENQRQFAVYLGQEWMTGIFLDQREVRDFLASQSQGQSVLNLFSYTGAFSVVAADGGAEQTVSVDIANRSVERTQENFALNHIPLQINHEIRVMDVFDYIHYAQKQQLQFGIVVCDPPSFARNKRGRFSVEKDYGQLARQLFQLTQVGGLTLISTNHSGYDKAKFIEDMLQVTQQLEGAYHLIQVFGLPQDYPTTKDKVSQYLKVLVFYRSA